MANKFKSLDDIEVTAKLEKREETVDGYTTVLPVWIITYPEGEIREMHDSVFADHYKEVK